MSAQDVQAHILEPMQRLYLPPRNMDEGAQSEALREYVAALERFEADDLKSAWTNVRDSHMTRAWPVPAAFITEARKARDYRVPRRPANDQRPKPADLWERWKQVKHGDKAKEAVKRGVSWSFKCAILDGKYPEEVNLTELVIARQSAERTAGMIERRDPIPYKGRTLIFSDVNAELALKMWRNILVKNAETEAEIMGRVA